MDSYDLDAILSLDKSRRTHDRDSENSEPDEVGFSKVGRFTKRQKKDQMSLNGYESDSFDEDDSDDDTMRSDVQQKPKDSANDSIPVSDSENEDQGGMPPDQSTYDLDFENSKLVEDSVPLEAFNIKEENKHGSFDTDGNYIRAKNDEQDAANDQDQWIEDVKDVNSVLASQKTYERRVRQKEAEQRRKIRHYMIDEALSRLQYFIKSSDTVLTALARFNQLRNCGEPEGYIINAINFVTEVIDILERKGIKDVYGLTRLELRNLAKEESISESAIDNYKTKLWSFKWIEKPDAVHGLYTNYQMQYWKENYFHNKVIVKFFDEPDLPSNWILVDCVNFM
ncbi:LIN1 (YHR156C) [Zygosaccharomyces parabailii]|nr:LIN1 (YHR156C) [Zygosaccharomyces parabailii]